VALASLTAYVVSGPALVAALCAEAVALARVGRASGDATATTAAVAFLAAAGAHVLWFEAPPVALVEGARNPGEALLSLGSVAAAATAWASGRAGPARLPRGLGSVAPVTMVYGVSVLIVSAFQPEVMTPHAGPLDLGVRQQGQVLLSGFWSVTGLSALIAGLRRDSARLRGSGFGLLGLALAKAFAYDLSTLDSLYRVLSFMALGLLLLAAAVAYQRARPQPRIEARAAPADGPRGDAGFWLETPTREPIGGATRARRPVTSEGRGRRRQAPSAGSRAP
jgi:hypothetical protein